MKFLGNPGSLPSQDPCQPKIPLNPRSQSALDALMPFWFMPVWCLAHAYLVFGSCYCIWLMWNLHQPNFSSIYYIPTWISVMCIWQIHIFPSLKKLMSQGPAVFSFSNFFQFHYCLLGQTIWPLWGLFAPISVIVEL